MVILLPDGETIGQRVDATQITGRPVLTTPPPEVPDERRAPSLALLRLHGATAAYLAILRATLPAVETMGAYPDPPELRLTPDVATPILDLAEAVREAFEVDDAPGTPAAIKRLVGAALDDAAHAGRSQRRRYCALLGSRAGDRGWLELAPGAVTALVILCIE